MDIVTLQEAWQSDAVSSLLQEARDELPYYVIDQPAKQAKKATSGGLAVLSRWPIEEVRTMLYDDCHLDDCTASKGAVHVVVRMSKDSILNVIATHLDAGDSSEDSGYFVKERNIYR